MEFILKMSEKQSILINGIVGELEINVAEPVKKEGNWVVICHPHPSYGGTMNNKVITTLQKSFHLLGYGTVIFNFRGVGSSVGSYDGGIGEQEDLSAVVDWLRTSFEVEKLILSGFSFGGYIALKKATQLQADGLCIVAPAVGMYDFSDIHINMDWTLIQGGEDEVISSQEVVEWAMKQPVVPDLYWRATASHFFHRQLVWLRGVIKLTYK